MLRKVHMSPKEKRDEMLGVLVPSTIKSEVETICEDEQRSLSLVSYLLLLRGLELYRVDGALKNSERLAMIVKGISEDLHPLRSERAKPRGEPAAKRRMG